jgi:hypothetical protein
MDLAPTKMKIAGVLLTVTFGVLDSAAGGE